MRKKHACAPYTSQQMASDPGSHFWHHLMFPAEGCFVPAGFCWPGSLENVHTWQTVICPNTHSFYASGSGVLQPGIRQVWCLKGHVPYVGLVLVLQWRLIPGSRCNCHRGSEKVHQDTTPIRQSQLKREGSGTKAEVYFSLLDEVLELMENENQSLYVTPSPQGLFIRRG